MSTTATGDTEAMPLLLGVSVIVIILVAYFSSREGDGGKKKKAVAAAAASAMTAGTTSKKSKKKKPSSSSSSKAKADPLAVPSPPPPAGKEVAVREPPAPPVAVEAEPEETDPAKKKKKRKPKKKSPPADEADPSSAPAALSSANGGDDSDDEDDDDVELWRIQLVAKKAKGGVVAIDAAKRAAANKERDRVRAIRRQEEKAKAAARAIADEEDRIRAEEEAAAAASALVAKEKEEKLAEAVAAKAKKNGNGASAHAGANGKAVALANGVEAATAAASPSDADAVVAEKKKRKRSKKKGGLTGVPESRPALVKPAAPPSVEHWEVVPKVEEWQEVNTKKAKPKVAPPADAVVPPGGDAAAGVGADAPPLSEEPAYEQAGETSVTISAGDDPLIIIGKGGATIQNLQETTGAKFHLNRSTNLLTITGPEDAVQLGLVAAQAILAAEAHKKATEVEERLTWGSDAIKAVIGRGGANIRAAQESTGTRIDADVDAGTLTIAGPADQVSIALTMCHNAAFGEVQDVLELGSRNAVNLVYGPNFQTIRTLQDSTGCKLDIARGGTTLKFAGSTEAVADARAQVLALLETNRGFEMTIEISKVGGVYGKGGETLRSIQDRTGTQIDVVRGPTHATVSVMGTVEASGRARNMLQRAIDGEVELKPGDVAEEIELGVATAAVIGRGGSNVAELEKKHGVKVNVRSEFQKARVVGKPEKVEAAVKEIEAIVKPILAAKSAQKKADDELESGESAWVANPDDDADGW